MRTFFALLLTTGLTISALLLPTISFSQPTNFRIKQSCSFDDVEPSADAYLYDPSDEAGRIVSEIVDALGLTKNFLVRASGVRNAVATTEGLQRYILYSTTFLEKFKGDEHTRWAAYAVLAHEIGHHLNYDNFGETDMRRRKLYELEADRFSGSVLRMLGARLDQAQSGIESIERETESTTHPAKAARREAVATGWKKRDEFLRSRGDGSLPTAPADTDGDGVADSRDQCPNEYGTHSSGCPDADEDGVLDKNDRCPYQKGLAANSGCPVVAPTDSDGDGVPDNADPCPTKKGEKRYSGCPDTDGDGVPDNKDDCPNTMGAPEKKGCPEENKTLRGFSAYAIGGVAKIVNDGNIYPTINTIDCLKWESPEIKRIAGRDGWKKSRFEPKNGMVGQIIDIQTHCNSKKEVLILLIDNKHYVPIGVDGVESRQ